MNEKKTKRDRANERVSSDSARRKWRRWQVRQRDEQVKSQWRVHVCVCVSSETFGCRLLNFELFSLYNNSITTWDAISKRWWHCLMNATKRFQGIFHVVFAGFFLAWDVICYWRLFFHSIILVCSRRESSKCVPMYPIDLIASKYAHWESENERRNDGNKLMYATSDEYAWKRAVGCVYVYVGYVDISSFHCGLDA